MGLLYSFLPPRSHLAEAASLYSLMDEQLHILVTTSNHLLGRLELRVRLGRLEAAIHQVKGEPGLGDVGASAWKPTTGNALLQAWLGVCSGVRTGWPFFEGKAGILGTWHMMWHSVSATWEKT